MLVIHGLIQVLPNLLPPVAADIAPIASNSTRFNRTLTRRRCEARSQGFSPTGFVDDDVRPRLHLGSCLTDICMKVCCENYGAQLLKYQLLKLYGGNWQFAAFLSGLPASRLHAA